MDVHPSASQGVFEPSPIASCQGDFGARQETNHSALADHFRMLLPDVLQRFRQRSFQPSGALGELFVLQYVQGFKGSCNAERVCVVRKAGLERMVLEVLCDSLMDENGTKDTVARGNGLPESDHVRDDS